MISNNLSRSPSRSLAFINDSAKNTDKGASLSDAPSANSAIGAEQPSFGNAAALRESNLASSAAGKSDADVDVQDVFREQFSDLASDQGAFHAMLRDVFGDEYDAQAGETIRQQSLAGDFSWLPKVEFVDAGVLGDGVGAYDSENDRILLNSDFRGSALLSRIFTEEVGHALDARLNTADTAGDEGELFQMLVAGEKPDAAQRQTMLMDNDHGSVVVNGEKVDVEFGWNPFKDVVDFVKDEIIEPVVDFVQDEVIDPINEHIVEPLMDHVVNPVLDFGESLIDIGKDLIRFPFEIAHTLVSGGQNFVSALFSGDWSEAGQAVVSTFQNIAQDTVGQLVDTAVMTAHATVNLVEAVTGQIEERPLSQAEVDYLRPIYGDSIDYAKVTVQSGGLKESLNMRANVVGNDIFMPDDHFGADGVTLNEAGLETLGHEMGHIWQFQNRGPEYISGALAAQNSQGSGGVGTGEAYDWLAVADEGVGFNGMNPESQAELASFIGLSIDPVTGEVDEIMLETAIADELEITSYDVSAQTLAIVMEAHDILRAG